MDVSYLRVKNWGEFQHYRDKEPGWIKLYAKLLRESLFLELDEATQWQLVRLWIAASQAARFTLDDENRRVPVLVDSEQSLRRAIASVKPIPLKRLVKDGWLIPVSPDELTDDPSSPALDDGYTASRPGLGSSRAGVQTRGNRVSEAERTSKILDQDPGRQFPARNGSNDESLPSTIDSESEFLVAGLLGRIGDHADDGTPNVIRSYARSLPPAALAKVIESIDLNQPRDPAAYAVSALRSEQAERQAA